MATIACGFLPSKRSDSRWSWITWQCRSGGSLMPLDLAIGQGNRRACDCLLSVTMSLKNACVMASAMTKSEEAIYSSGLVVRHNATML